MSTSTFNNADMAAAFFGEVKSYRADEKIPCKGGCGKKMVRPKSGFTTLISHIESHHKETMMDFYAEFVKVRPQVNGPMDAFNAAKYCSPSAKKVIHI
jgi:hypothetical protein